MEVKTSSNTLLSVFELSVILTNFTEVVHKIPKPIAEYDAYNKYLDKQVKNVIASW